eukprot:Nk52_evm2s388 gene=Nk52_evmTU2s388
MAELSIEKEEVATCVPDGCAVEVKKEKKNKDKKDKKKKDKKEKKEKKVDGSEPTKEEAEMKKQKKKEKKDKKKKRKREEEEGEKQKEKSAKQKTSESISTGGQTSEAKTKTEGGIRKAFYNLHPELAAMDSAVIDTFAKENNIEVTDPLNGGEHRPALAFKHAGFSEDIMKCLASFEKPTPIQSQTWPIVLSGRDVVGIAETGSGKTMAFALPGMVHLKARITDHGPPKKKTPYMLVICPTRELAMQSAEVCEQAGGICGLRSTCVYGGVDKNLHRNVLKRGVDIVVATPGRLLDLADEGAVDLRDVSYLVLDEADRMLDMGFEKDMRKIISYMKPTRQTLMFSATWPQEIRELASQFLSTPVKVTIGSPDLGASSNVTQIVEVLDPRDKDQKLINLLNQYHKSRKNRVLVFVLYKKEAARVEQMLLRRGFRATGIHGDKSQRERTEAFNKFKDASQPLLVATDVAARGLDIPNVEYVINYTFPLTIEDYVHRIGRTGRGGKKGTSHTFFTMHDKSHSGELCNVLKESNQEVPADLTKFGTHVKRKEHKLYGLHYKADDDRPMKASSHVKF